MRSPHPHRSKGTHATDFKKPCKYHGGTREAFSGCLKPRQLADEPLLQNGRPKIPQGTQQKKPKTMAALADIWYTANGAGYGRNNHYNESRYHMLNYHATFTKGTVEFRLFQFDAPADGKLNGLHAGQLKSYIQLCLALSQMAKEVRTASPKPQQTENPEIRNEDMAFEARIHWG